MGEETDNEDLASDPSTSLSRTRKIIESTAGVFFAFVVGFVVFIAGGVIMFDPFEDDFPLWLRVSAGAVIVAEGSYLYWLKNALESELRPFAPQCDLRQPAWPIVLRPFFAAWWCAHLSIAVLAQFGLEQLIDNATKPSPSPSAELAIKVCVIWAISHCSLLYLFLVITALWKSTTLIFALWRYRLAIDLVFTVGLVAASQFLKT